MELWNLQSRLPLSPTLGIPRLGLGVWKMSGPEAFSAVSTALKLGYRHIDTAAVYGNESEVGEAIRKSGIPRDEIFVTTKLWTEDHEPNRVPTALQRSVGLLRLGAPDLYLSHYPVSGKRLGAWRQMERLLESGRCRAIGVSNYTIRHLEELLKHTQITPAVNQVEFHPFLFQKDLLDYCREHRIQLEAYSPLTHGRKLKDPTVGAVARKHGKSPAQVLIRWALQHGLVVIPKSSRPERIKENAEVFDFTLAPDEMDELNGLHEDLRTCWDPTDEP